MLVVADASPLIVLVNIQSIDVLPKLFDYVRIPPQVAAELRRPIRPDPVQEFISSPPAWLIEQAPSKLLPIPNLDPGEHAAISLAEEIHADLILIDELKGRRAAAIRNLTLTGTIGVLELAATKKFLDLRSAFDRIKQTGFWISHELLDQRLALFRSNQGSPMTIKEFQEHIRTRYGARDTERGVWPTFGWFMEEVGELASALHSDDVQNKHEEFADVFAWLLTLANIQGIDLQKAIDEKYFKNGGPQGHK